MYTAQLLIILIYLNKDSDTNIRLLNISIIYILVINGPRSQNFDSLTD
jgi:hypothetical protein